MDADEVDMTSVKQIIPVDGIAGASNIILGGQAAQVAEWPLNPEGEPLVLVAAINCSRMKKALDLESMPNEGALYIFSTYSKSDYFLEDITYSGDASELDNISGGYTKVVLSDSREIKESPADSIPEVSTRLQDREVSSDEFPVFSMVSKTPPNGFNVPEEISKNYDFALQLYSSDFPEPFKDIFYLTDAVGYLLLKKEGFGEGLFFVQTA
jgi:uncharacterized protein YwqG